MSAASSSSDKFVFKSNSADKAPGKGVHEFAADEYSALAKIKDFRRYLSNFDSSCTFVWQGPFEKPYTFRSIEHAFQAAKIYIADPVAAMKFTVESGDSIGSGEGHIAQKNRKLVKLTPAQLSHWDSISKSIMASAADAKYTQNVSSVSAQVLKATGRAELWHLVTVRGKSSYLVRFEHLECIRSRLF
jgi:hypothetical protein